MSELFESLSLGGEPSKKLVRKKKKVNDFSVSFPEIEVNCTENSAKVLKTRYLIKNKKGELQEEPKDLFKRVAKVIGKIDMNYGADGVESAKEFYRMMANFEFMPNSPTLMNAGRPLGQLSACFVLPVGDSMVEIFEAIKQTAVIHQTGGGTGFSFSRLRPKNDIVKSTMGKSSGPVSFMKVFNEATDAIKQGGTRRGANMGILRVDHPDIVEFIECKRDLSQMTNFNISVALTDKFMEALAKDEEYELINPSNKEVWGKISAREVFDNIIENAWYHGDPGIVFIDRINQNIPVNKYGSIEATNPCGEQPLEPYGSCNLGSINLSRMVAENNGSSHVDYDKLRKTVRNAVRFLDNVIDANKYPLPQIEEVSKSIRRIGLGVMGFADMLIKLSIPYNSAEAVRIAEDVMSFVNSEAWKMSRELAGKRGAFPLYEESNLKSRGEEPSRNGSITTIAPTGTISIITNCSSGIEPLFAISYLRENVLGGDQTLIEVNPLFEKLAKQRGFYSESLMKKIAQKGSLQEIMEVPEDVRRVFVTSHDITPEWHLKIQAAFQKYVDNAVSKTVNFGHEATQDDVRKAYMMAYDMGCKGVTIYRDGCRDKQVLNIAGTKDLQKKSENASTVNMNLPTRSIIIPKERPRVLEGKTIKIETGDGNLFITVNQDEDGHPFELFATMGKSGGFSAAQTEAIGRLISLCFRSGLEPQQIIKQLKGIRSDRPIGFGPSRVLSSPDAIAKALEVYLQPPLDLEFDKEDVTAVKEPIVKDEDVKKEASYSTCNECGGVMEHEGGCSVCHDCGFSECG